MMILSQALTSTTTPEDTPVTFNIFRQRQRRGYDSPSLTRITSGDSIAISAVTGAQHGSTSYDSGELTYTPDADFNGTENITYTLSDQHGGVVTGYVTITVSQVYDAPRAQDDTKTAPEDTADVVIEVLTNDYKPGQQQRHQCSADVINADYNGRYDTAACGMRNGGDIRQHAGVPPGCKLRRSCTVCVYGKEQQ